MNPQPIREDLLIEQFFDGRLEQDAEEEFLAAFLGDPERLEKLRTHFRDRQLAERFHGGGLSSREQAAIETIGMADPELFDELVLVERARQAYRDAETSGELDTRLGRSGGWTRFFGTPQYAAAASVLLAVSLVFSGVMYLKNLELAGTQGAFAGATVTRTPLVTTRSGDSTNVIDQPAPDEWKMLLVDSGIDYPSYRVTVTRVTGGAREQLVQADDLEPGYDLQLQVIVPGRLLTPGEYEVLVEGAAGGGRYERISAVPLRVTPRP